MTNKNILYSSLFVVFLFLNGYSQKSKVAAADKKYENSYFVDAIATYERIAEKGYKDEKMFLKLGNAYYYNADLPKAEKWYTELYTLNKEQEPEFYFRYSQSLKSVGKYEMANKMMEEFDKKSGNDSRAKLYLSNKNYLDIIKANSGHYAVQPAEINSQNSDFGGTLLGNTLVFTSARQVAGGSSKVFNQTKEAFTDLFESEMDADGKLLEPKPFGGTAINTKLHESSPVFTKDGKTVYFTRNNFINGKKGKIVNDIMVIKLYKATFENDSWGNITELSINSNDYNVANPALSLDEKTLYFVSDMPGSLGQSDVFKVDIKSDGSLGEPVNLGKNINTEGRESFPFVSFDNKLYFASDGRPGLGGFDVFVAAIEKDGSFKTAENVGAPINGSLDDFAFSIQSNGKGFVSSNREGGKGNDDIYLVTKLECKQKLEGIITDAESNLALAEVKVSLYSEKFELIKESKSDEKGKYSFAVDCGKKYYIRTEMAEYNTKEVLGVIGDVSGTTNLDVAIEKAGCKLVVGGDLAKCFGIKVIYFDLNKAAITKSAEFELEKILDVMNQNPKIALDIRSHTDSRQSAQYNQVLSDKRAKATIEWLIKKGVDASRLTGKGYGESQLLNKCADGVPCTEEEHQVNRRSEFIVTAM
jgi:outer membrane protein OmpA-like peptidoglycan-associated protein/tetratricopeptide (TPR) repeat protein